MNAASYQNFLKETIITSSTRSASPTRVKPKTYPPLKAVKKPSFKSLI
ncbi:MAG: hypothetical protein ACK5NI_02210 [bacterium]